MLRDVATFVSTLVFTSSTVVYSPVAGSLLYKGEVALIVERDMEKTISHLPIRGDWRVPDLGWHLQLEGLSTQAGTPTAGETATLSLSGVEFWRGGDRI